MSQYDSIDATLAEWARENSLRWYSEYQETEVRTFYLNPESRDRVQIAVDVPSRGKTVVRIGQLRDGISRRARVINRPTSVADLSSALDEALQTARDWLSEGEAQTDANVR